MPTPSPSTLTAKRLATMTCTSPCLPAFLYFSWAAKPPIVVSRSKPSDDAESLGRCCVSAPSQGSGAPHELPRNPRGGQSGGGFGDGLGRAARAVTKDPFDSVCAWYRKNLADANGEHKTDDGAAIFYTKSGATVDVEPGNRFDPGKRIGLTWDAKKFGA